MEPKEFLAFLARLEKLKCNTRHSWTSSGRHESVAEHSWRLAMLAMLVPLLTRFRRETPFWLDADWAPTPLRKAG